MPHDLLSASPHGAGEMAARIREHDWAATPLGAVETWPSALRSTVELLVSHGFPMVALWGPELIQIYNDGYRVVMGNKHPEGLAQPTAECWPEIWHINEPIYRRVWAGETLTFEDVLHPITRSGKLEDAWFTLTYSPVRDENGRIAGILVTVFETTRRLLVEEALRTESGRAWRSSEGPRRVALAGGRMGTWRWDLGNRLVWGDAQFLALWGFPPSEEAHPLSLFTERMSPEGAAEMQIIVTKAIEANDEFDGPLEIVAGPTTGRWIQWRGRAYADDPTILFGVTFDVTDQRRVEQALRESEARHRLLIGSWAQAVWETDADGVVIADSPSWRAYTGQTLEEWLGYGWLNAINPDDRVYAERQWREAIAVRGLVDAEFRLRAPRGGWRWTNVRAAPVLDANGKVEKWVGMNIDIDASKQADTALRESEERLRTFGEASSDVLWIRDVESLRWTYLTPAFETIYGMSREEALGGDDFRTWADLIVAEDRQKAVDRIRHVRDGERVTFDYRIRRPSDGSIRWLRNTDFPIRDAQGCVTAIGGVGHDATDELEAAEALRESEARLQVLVAELQHRTRNLLTVVRSVADRTAVNSASLEEFGPRFRDRLGALSRINGMLSTLKRGQRVTFDEMIRTELDALGWLEADMAERVQLEGPTGIRLRSATVQTFALAIHELTTNAVKYGALSDGLGKLTVRWSRIMDEDGTERLVVEWVESQVADMRTPEEGPRGGGYGRELIERALPYQLKARTTYELRPDGVRCTIDLPLR